VVVRTGSIFRRYFLKLKDAEARPGDVLVVVGRDWYVLRPAQKAEVWVGDGVIRLRGEAVRFPINAIPQKLLLDYAAQVAWGKTALVAAKAPRARIRWPKRYDPEVSPFARDLAEIAQSPALVALADTLITQWPPDSLKITGWQNIVTFWDWGKVVEKAKAIYEAAVTAGLGLSIFIAVAAAVAYLFSRVPHAIGVE